MPNSPKMFRMSKPARPSASQRGYDVDHRRRRQECLRRAGYICQCAGCEYCTESDSRPCTCMATVADHIVRHAGNVELLGDMDNYQALCKPCHDEKTRGGE